MKLNPKVYLKAAKLISNKIENFACHALIKQKGKYPYNEFDLFIWFFKPENARMGAWYSFTSNNVLDSKFGTNVKLGRLGRSLMLLFMHEIVKDLNKRKNK